MSKHNPVRSSLLFLCIVATVYCGGARSARAASPTPPPNIIVILLDDLGFSDLGCYGSEVPTPHIDALAAGGVRFTQFYNTARCSPTRASLLTGLYPHQAGMGHLESVIHKDSKGTTGRLRNDCVTIAEVLGSAGYFTIMTGKWHLGQDHGTPPWSRGFTRSLSSKIGEIYFPDQRQRREDGIHLNGEKLSHDDSQLGLDWYGPDLLTNWGLGFVDEALAAKQPFFWYLPHSSVHFPLQVPQADIAHYQGKYLINWDKLRVARHRRQIKMGLVDAKWTLTERPPDVPAWDSLSDDEKNRCDQIMAIYAAMIDRVDRSVGTLVAGLRERGVLDNTLIILLSDNGGNAESGPRGRLEGDQPGGPQSTVYLGQSWATLANTPFWRYKHFTHEGGISSPLIVHWPERITAERRGQLERQPGHLIDIMPTVVEVSGARYPTEFNSHAIQPMEGVSLVPALAGAPLQRVEPIYFEHEGNRAVRAGKWKLVLKHRGEWELYDMEADRTERHNVVDQQPELAADLISQWETWAQRADVGPWTGLARTDWGDEPTRRAKAPVAK